MVRLRHWWSRLGGLVAACVIAVLVANPVLDTIICQDDGDQAVATATLVSGQAVVDIDHSMPDRERGDVGVCVHGHCHHVAANAPADLVSGIHLTPVLGRLASMADSQHDSEAPNRLERPPRA